MTEEILFTELAQLLRIDMVEVDVEAGCRLQQILQGVRVVVGRRIDIGIPARTRILQHFLSVIIAAHAAALPRLRMNRAEAEIRIVLNMAENVVVKGVRRD